MISIVTSLYRADRHIQKYVRRVIRVSRYLRTRKEPFEVVIIPNEPTPVEAEALLRLRSCLSECKVIEVQRETLYASWNRGIGIAKGEAICFWNVDDVRFGRALVAGLQSIRRGGELVYFPFLILKKHKYWKYLPVYRPFFDKPPRFDRGLFRTGMFCGPFFMFSRDLIEKIGPFDKRFVIAGDFEWCVRAADKGAQFCRSRVIAGLYIKERHTLSGSSGNSRLQGIENQAVYRKYGISSKYDDLSSSEMDMVWEHLE